MIAKLIGTKTFWTSLAGAVVGMVTLVGVVAAHGDLTDPRVAAAATAGAALAALIGNIGSIFAAHDAKTGPPADGCGTGVEVAGGHETGLPGDSVRSA